MARLRHGVLNLLATAAVAAGALAGCNEAPRSATPGPQATTAPSPAVIPTAGTHAPPVVPETLRFTAKTVSGGEFDGSRLAGKPVIFWFWAAWCPKCRAAADDVREVAGTYSQKVQTVGVAGLGSGIGGMRQFVADHQLEGIAHLADDAGAVWRKFGVTTQEYYVILDASGAVVHKGPLTPDALRDRAAALSA